MKAPRALRAATVLAACSALLLLARPADSAASASTRGALGAAALAAEESKTTARTQSSESLAKPEGQRVVTKIVKLLENMMTKSKEDGDAERTLYGKYKCYCDTNEAAKAAEIEALSGEIATLEGKLEETLAHSGLLSKEVEKLYADMAANQHAQEEAAKLHDKEKTAFEAKEEDLETGIRQLKDAVEALSEVAADQTMQAAADHKQYMAGYKQEGSLLKLQATVKQALVAASAFVSKAQARSVGAFLEGPFTGTYAAQSGEIVGILKDMRDTFAANLDEARRSWKAAEKAHAKYMGTMEAEYSAMDRSYIAKQGSLGTNDASLSTLRDQLETAKSLKSDAEEFVSSLSEQCEAKAAQYEKRMDLRVSEEAAISQAINILNSDASFATFGGTTAGTTGPTSLLQERSLRIRRHRSSPLLQKGAAVASALAAPKAFLQHGEQAHEQAGSLGMRSVLGKIATMLKAGSPFDTVLSEIKKMLGLIDQEAQADLEHKDWCVKERDDSDKTIQKKTGEISFLAEEVNTLKVDIDDPKVGLLEQIKTAEDVLRDCVADQKQETSERTAENLEYQKEVENLVQAQDLISRAINVLKKYYDKLAEEQASSLLQAEKAASNGREEPAPPKTWKDTYTGQGEHGNSAIEMLDFLLTNTQKEETVAHDTELSAQQAFEDEMKRLKGIEGDTQDSLSDLRLSLAEKQKALRQKSKDLAAATKEKEAVEAYLEEIKPGCDFIVMNIQARDYNRQQETNALTKADAMIKDTPVYKDAMLAKHIEGLGDCAEICKAAGEEKVQCKACLADTSVPGYCAAHPATMGC